MEHTRNNQQKKIYKKIQHTLHFCLWLLCWSSLHSLHIGISLVYVYIVQTDWRDLSNTYIFIVIRWLNSIWALFYFVEKVFFFFSLFLPIGFNFCFTYFFHCSRTISVLLFLTISLSCALCARSPHYLRLSHINI